MTDPEPRSRLPRRIGALVLAASLLVVGAACSGDDGEEGTATTTSTEEPGVPAPADVVVSDVWCRNAPDDPARGECYLTMQNKGRVEATLVGVTVPAEVAAEAVLEVAEVGVGVGLTDAVVVPGAQTIQLRPGGYAIVLSGLAGPLEPGTTVALSLDFGDGSTSEQVAEVRPG